MSLNSDTNLATTNHNSNTKTVTSLIANTHCIVCGSAFPKIRVGKLYCSNRCKQFGYNHKDENFKLPFDLENGINQKPISFFIDDYCSYNAIHKKLKRFRELEYKRNQWDSLDKELSNKQELNLQIKDYFLENYLSKKLLEEEENELDNAETEIPEAIIDLIPKELTLEQWSFVKSLYPTLDEISFFVIVCSLSKEFIKQLNLIENDSVINTGHLLVKNKFINHCNLIAMGIIQFTKREILEETS